MKPVRCVLVRVAMVVIVLTIPRWGAAQNRVGGHFGAVFPLVSHAGGETTTIGDDFTVGFPMGITVKLDDRWAFDLELVPVIQNDPLFVSLTVHPGIIRGLSKGYAAGVRLAFDANAASWGFTPLVNKSFPIEGHASSWFVEGVMPVRFQEDPDGGVQTSIGFAVHVGIGF